MKPTLHIEMISDFICPWCYIAKVRLNAVKEALAEEINIEVHLRPYVLYPHIPVGGLPKSDFAKKTKPGMGKSLRQEAKLDQIEINYKNIERIPNSLEAHRLIQLVDDLEIKFKLARNIFTAYFEHGQDIENHQVLINLGKKSNVKASILQEFKSSDSGLVEVLKSIETSKNQHFNLVPVLILNKTVNIPGLHSTEVLKNYFRRAAKMQQV